MTTIIDDDSGHVLTGSSSKDTINARGGDDTVYAGSGDDKVRAGDGQDVVYGGKGDDEIHGGQGDDKLYGQQGDDEIHGGQGQDQILGGQGDDDIYGDQGDDKLFGGRGDDTIHGGDNNDTIDGGKGDDVLFGDDGDDKIDGGANDGSDDVLTGGSGHDRFLFSGKFGDDIVTDFTTDDTIDLTKFSPDGITFTQDGSDVVIDVPGKGTVTVRNASVADVQAHTEVACLMRGTLVLTPKGEVAVEALAIGDLVTTIDGEAAKVKWIGTRAYARAFVTTSLKVAPVLFTAGSLGETMPSRDLYVSPEHAMLVDDVLVPAKLLVNGESIRQVSHFDVVEYFHVELDEAEVLVTNGAPSESYVEHDNRRMFANHADYIARYGDEAPQARKRRRFYEVHGGAALDAIRLRLKAEAAAAA